MKLINLTVVLYATLGQYHPQGKGSWPFILCLPAGSTVEEMLQELGMAEKVRHVFINNQRCTQECFLEDGQKVIISSPIAGG